MVWWQNRGPNLKRLVKKKLIDFKKNWFYNFKHTHTHVPLNNWTPSLSVITIAWRPLTFSNNCWQSRLRSLEEIRLATTLCVWMSCRIKYGLTSRVAMILSWIEVWIRLWMINLKINRLIAWLLPSSTIPSLSLCSRSTLCCWHNQLREKGKQTHRQARFFWNAKQRLSLISIDNRIGLIDFTVHRKD